MKTLRTVFSGVVLMILALACATSTARAAVAEFFWAGFHIADGEVDAMQLQEALYKDVDPLFRGSRKGAVPGLLQRLKFDEYAYHESAGATGYTRENFRDVYGIFLSIDKVMTFDPMTDKIAGTTVRRYFTYVFATLNVFSADSRNLVFSQPLILAGDGREPPQVASLVTGTLKKFAVQLGEPSGLHAKRIETNLQRFFGKPGQSLEAIRRTAKPLHKTDGYFENTYGVSSICSDCVQLEDDSGQTNRNAKRLAEFTRFYLNSRLSDFHPVAFVPEQARIVQDRTGGFAVAAKEGDVQRDFSQTCLPEYDETGQSRICVRVLPPRNAVHVGIFSLVKREERDGGLSVLRFLTEVDMEIELAGAGKSITPSVSSDYSVPTTKTSREPDAYYVNAVVKAIEHLKAEQLR